MPSLPQKQRLVFLIHGRNHFAKKAISQFLESLDLRVLDWEQVVACCTSRTPSNHQVVEKGFELCHAAIALWSPDDIARCKRGFLLANDGADERNLTGQPRQNVIYETGMAMMKQPENTIVVEIGQL